MGWTVYAGHRLDHPFVRVTGYFGSKARALSSAQENQANPNSLDAQLAMVAGMIAFDMPKARDTYKELTGFEHSFTEADYSDIEHRVLAHMATPGKLVAEDARDRFNEAFPSLKAWHDGMGTVTGRLSRYEPEPQYFTQRGSKEEKLDSTLIADLERPFNDHDAELEALDHQERPKNQRHLPQGDLAARTGNSGMQHTTPAVALARLQALKDRFK